MKKNILIFVMVVVIVILGFFAVPNLDEVKHGSFSTLQEARSSGLEERGWIPASFPDCLRDVEIITNLDSNEAFYKFTLPQDCR